MKASEARRRATETVTILLEAEITRGDDVEIIKDLIVSHLTGEKTFYELVVDHPVVANFKLKPAEDRKVGLRLSYYGFNEARLAWAREIDQRIATIS